MNLGTDALRRGDRSSAREEFEQLEQRRYSRLLELPGDHACHIQNLDRFLEELARHTAVAGAPEAASAVR